MTTPNQSDELKLYAGKEMLEKVARLEELEKWMDGRDKANFNKIQQLQEENGKLKELLKHHHERDLAGHHHYKQTELCLRTEEALKSEKGKDL